MPWAIPSPARDRENPGARVQLIVFNPTDQLSSHLIATVARQRGHAAWQVASLEELREVPVKIPATVVFGVTALDGDALLVLAEVRAARKDALIYVAAEEIDHHLMVDALQRGASDVLIKPVLPVEILTRAEVAWKNRGAIDQSMPSSVEFEDIAIDLDEAQATKAGIPLALTRVELMLLHCLAAHQPRVAPTEQLLTVTGEADELAPSALKSHVSRLRRKLRDAGGRPLTITARRALGYSLEVATN